MPYRNRRLRRRWYFDAQVKGLPKSLPLIGGAGGARVRFGNNKAKALIKRQVLKQEETKESFSNIINASLVHNTLFTTRLNNITQGTANNQRIGDRVFYCGFNIKLTVVTEEPSILLRYYVIKHRDTFMGVDATTFGSGVQNYMMFRNSDMSPNSWVNTDNVNVIASGRCELNARYVGQNMVKHCRLNVKLMKPFQFRTGSVTEGEYFNYYLVVLPWNNRSVPLPNEQSFVANVAAQVEQIYKDA